MMTFRNLVKGMTREVAGFFRVNMFQASQFIRGVTRSLLTLQVAGKTLQTTLSLALEAGELERSLAKVQVFSRATAREFEEMRQAAVAMSLQTRFSAAEAAEGLRRFAQAGFSSAEAMEALAPALDLAVASTGQLDIEKSVGLTISVLKAFNTSIDSTRDGLDKLFRIARQSDINFKDLGEAMGKVGGAASTINASLVDTFVSLGLVRDVMKQTGLASTGISRIMERLGRPKTIEGFKSLGIQITDANGKFKPFLNTMVALEKHLSGLSPEERLATLKGVLPDVKTMRVLTILLKRIGDEARKAGGGVADFDKALASLRTRADEANGSIREAAETIQKQFLERIEVLKSTFKTFLQVVGEPFAKIFGLAIGVLQTLLEVIVRIANAIPTPIKSFLGFALVFATLSTALAAFISLYRTMLALWLATPERASYAAIYFGRFKDEMVAFSRAMWTGSIPALTAFRAAILGIPGFLLGVLKTTGSLFLDLGVKLGSFLAAVRAFSSGFAAGLASMFAPLVPMARGALSIVLTEIILFAKAVPVILGTLFSVLGRKTVELIRVAIGATGRNLVAELVLFAKAVPTILRALFVGLGKGSALLASLATFILRPISEMFVSTFISIGNKLSKMLVSSLSLIGSKVTFLASSMFGFVVSAAGNAAGKIGELFLVAFRSKIFVAISMIARAVPVLFASVFSAIAQSVVGIFGSTFSVLFGQRVLAEIILFAKVVPTIFKALFSSIAAFLGASIPKLFAEIVLLGRTAPLAIGAAISVLSTRLAGLVGLVRAVLPKIIGEIVLFAKVLPKILGTLFSVVGSKLFGPFVALFKTAFDAIATFFARGFITTIVAGLGGVGPAILALIATVGTLVAMWRSNFGGMRDFILPVLKKIKLAFMSIALLISKGEISGALAEDLIKAENRGILRFVKSAFAAFAKLRALAIGIAGSFLKAKELIEPIAKVFFKEFGETLERTIDLMFDLSTAILRAFGFAEIDGRESIDTFKKLGFIFIVVTGFLAMVANGILIVSAGILKMANVIMAVVNPVIVGVIGLFEVLAGLVQFIISLLTGDLPGAFKGLSKIVNPVVRLINALIEAAAAAKLMSGDVIGAINLRSSKVQEFKPSEIATPVKSGVENKFGPSFGSSFLPKGGLSVAIKQLQMMEREREALAPESVTPGTFLASLVKPEPKKTKPAPVPSAEELGTSRVLDREREAEKLRLIRQSLDANLQSLEIIRSERASPVVVRGDIKVGANRFAEIEMSNRSIERRRRAGFSSLGGE
jgi:TP901 family phage tail tape measure protein